MRKKILLTGMTLLQCHAHKRRRHDYVDNVSYIYDGLKKLGHKVYWKPFDIQKNYKYDLVLCGLAPHRSISNCFFYNALLSLSSSNNVMFYCDDWNIHPALYSKNAHKNLFNDFTMRSQNKQAKEIISNKYVRKNIDNNYNKLKNITFVLFSFPWGNHKMITNDCDGLIKKLYTIDYSSLYLKSLPDVKISQNKSKQWICASLKSRKDKYDDILIWPIKYFSSKNYISEHELITDIYSKNYGLISPKYYHSGSGWWRARILHSAYTKSILYADVNEIDSSNEIFSFDVFKVERYSDNKLRELANEQSKFIMRNISTEEEYLEQLKKIL